MPNWSPSSWRAQEILQAPIYDDEEKLQEVQKELASYPPLVFAKEVDLLKKKLQSVHLGQALILQGGDCAESFSRPHANLIRDFYKLILQMSVVLGFASGKEIIKIGRIAGQFAKPRSEALEVRNGVALPSYRGDMINGLGFSLEERSHDPLRMLRAYQQSASTLNLLRAFSKGGMADLHLLSQYNLEFVKNNPMGKRYKSLAREIDQALQFIQSCGVNLESGANFSEFFTSHESLLLHYEEALCRKDSLSGEMYDCSAHFLWIGERTLNSPAHIEFIRGIKNPKGIKVSARTSRDLLLKTLDVLNPQNQQGEIVLIVRMGFQNIQTHLAPLIEAIKQNGQEVIWISDPMHGNTTLENGVKTRYFLHMLDEVKSFFEICKESGARPSGLHLEMTGENVTECIGGSVTQEKLPENYITQCDPRLNATQALELAFCVAEILKSHDCPFR